MPTRRGVAHAALVAAALALAARPVGGAAGAAAPEVHVLGLFPLSVPGAHGAQLARAAELAAGRVSASAALLNGTALRMRVRDTNGSEARALAEAIDADAAHPLHAIVGALDADVTRALAAYGGARGVPVLSYGASARELSEPAALPLFARVVPSDALQARALADALVGHLGARRYALLHGADGRWSGRAARLELALGRAGAELGARASVERGADPTAALGALLNANARVLLLVLPPADTRAALLALEAARALGPRAPRPRALVSVGAEGAAAAAELWAAGAAGEAEAARLRGAAEGMLLAAPSTAHRAAEPPAAAAAAAEFCERWDGDAEVRARGWPTCAEEAAGGRRVPPLVPHAHDAVLGVAHALHAVCERAGGPAACADALRDGGAVHGALLGLCARGGADGGADGAPCVRGATGALQLDGRGDRVGAFTLLAARAAAADGAAGLRLEPWGRWSAGGGFASAPGSERWVRWPAWGEGEAEGGGTGADGAGAGGGAAGGEPDGASRGGAGPAALPDDLGERIGQVAFVLGTTLGMLFAMGLICVSQALQRRARVLLEAADLQRKAEHERVSRAVHAVTSVSFSVCFVCFRDFRRMGRLVPHEEMREAGLIVTCDTYEEVVAFARRHHSVFISHQWLGLGEPDPHCVHFPAIVAAVGQLAARQDMREEDVYMWVDYCSIPQRNLTLKSISIGSLAVYASVVRYFVVIAPPATHADTGQRCDTRTYQRRGWCRLQQWARMTFGGLQHMYVYDTPVPAGRRSRRLTAESVADAPPPLPAQRCSGLRSIRNEPQWYHDSIAVFEGEFTLESDKPKLVDAVLGLWALALHYQHRPEQRRIVELVRAHREAVFPAQFFGSLVGLLERRMREEGSDALITANVQRRASSVLPPSPAQQLHRFGAHHGRRRPLDLADAVDGEDDGGAAPRRLSDASRRSSSDADAEGGAEAEASGWERQPHAHGTPLRLASAPLALLPSPMRRARRRLFSYTAEEQGGERATAVDDEPDPELGHARPAAPAACGGVRAAPSSAASPAAARRRKGGRVAPGCSPGARRRAETVNVASIASLTSAPAERADGGRPAGGAGGGAWAPLASLGERASGRGSSGGETTLGDAAERARATLAAEAGAGGADEAELGACAESSSTSSSLAEVVV